MIDVLTILAFFMLGVLTGAVGIVSITLFFAKKTINKEKKKTSDKPSLETRMRRVKDITDEQVDLARRADGPQKNSLDGKYKNSLMRQIKALDEEKNEVLNSILADGHDPELTTIDGSGVVSKMKLSEYMAYMGYKAENTPQPPKKPSGPERLGKFTVYRGGKDDGDGGSGTVH